MKHASHPVLAAPVAPIGTHVMLVFLLQIALLLGAALLLGLLARRLRMPAVVGELCAGMLLGPSVLAHAAPGFAHWLLPARPEQQHLLDAVGQLGVLLLVGVTGMNVDLGMIRRQGLTAARVSAGGLLLPLAAGFGVGWVLPDALLAPGGDRMVFACFVAVAMCVSAIPVIAKTLLEMRLMHRDVGQLIVGASVVDDMVGWLLLSVVSAMATTGVRAGHLVFTVGALLGGIALAMTLGRPVVRTVLRRAAQSPEPAVTVATAVGLVVLCAAGTQALGVEPVVGAFFGGLLVAAVGWDAAPQRMTSLRTFSMGVLAPLFFATAGLRMDLTALGRPQVLGAAALVLAVAVVFKFAGAYLGARASRLGHWESLALGAGMNARGVIEVIIAMVGLRLGVLSAGMYTVVVLVAIATSLMAPPLLRTAVNRIEITGAEREREKVLLGG
ncbi:cation:proton antiporter [Actinomadura rupiterrae]|uniref:cation:proton antiporter n=1 Tax=Actinomadura rupiterrae TaxID=559627 RepID=UPI0020A5C263|nr:cation:proton antiporter [Actinomadura rupiterrae]MCP2341724.1 Kef-type K+ transport system membrane component KefB [Actinomadura rupiterrae]